MFWKIFMENVRLLGGLIVLSLTVCVLLSVCAVIVVAMFAAHLLLSTFLGEVFSVVIMCFVGLFLLLLLMTWADMVKKRHSIDIWDLDIKTWPKSIRDARALRRIREESWKRR